MFNVKIDHNPILRAERKREKTELQPVETYKLDDQQLREIRFKMIHQKSGLSREELIRRVANGETLLQIEKKTGMKQNEIYAWAKKWELSGINRNKANEMLGKRITIEEAQALKSDKPIEQPGEEIKQDCAEQSIEQERLSEKEQPSPQPASLETVGISKDLAKAITSARNVYDDNEILRGALTGLFDPVNGGAEIYEPLNNVQDMMILAKALLTGFHIIKTPEDLVRDAYNDIKWPVYEMSNDAAYRLGIKHALVTMGHDFKWLK